MSVRNAEPETIALAVLDACERAARDVSPDYNDVRDEDAQFMSRAMDNIKSRLRVLKRQAAAAWKPEFCSVLERCHSIAVEPTEFDEKEGVRTDKMKCMACGRWEHCCKYALHGVGLFKAPSLNNGTTNTLQEGWNSFIEDYEEMLDEDYVDYTRRNNLPLQDMGTYTIGATCLRKAELYYLINTFVLECCYEANVAYKERLSKLKRGETLDKPFTWVHANQENVDTLMEKLEQLELAIADERRPVPRWGTDEGLWKQIEKARMKAAGGDEDERLRLLRERANSLLGSEDGEEEEENDHDVVQLSEQEGEEDDDGAQPHRRNGSHRSAHARRVLESDDEAEATDAVEPCARTTRANNRQKRKGSSSTQPTRSSRRQRNLSPEDEAAFGNGPRNEGRTTTLSDFSDIEELDANEPPRLVRFDGAPIIERTWTDVEPLSESVRPVRGREKEIVIGSRRPTPNARSMAQQQRAPWGRLPGRQQALFNLGTLQLQLLQQGRSDDSAVCTNAMFVIQELLRRVDELEHSPHL